MRVQRRLEVPRHSTWVVEQRNTGVTGGAELERVLVNQELILWRLKKVEAGVPEVLARLQGLEEDEDE